MSNQMVVDSTDSTDTTDSTQQVPRFVLGTRECKFEDVIKVLYESAYAYKATENWRSLGRELEVEYFKDRLDLDEMRKDMQLDKYDNKAAVEKILKAWKLEKGNNANLPALIVHLRNMGHNDAIDKIENRFGHSSILC